MELTRELRQALELGAFRVQFQALAADAKDVRRLPQSGVLFGKRHIVDSVRVTAKRTHGAPDPATGRGEHLKEGLHRTSPSPSTPSSS